MPLEWQTQNLLQTGWAEGHLEIFQKKNGRDLNRGLIYPQDLGKRVGSLGEVDLIYSLTGVPPVTEMMPPATVQFALFGFAAFAP